MAQAKAVLLQPELQTIEIISNDSRTTFTETAQENVSKGREIHFKPRKFAIGISNGIPNDSHRKTQPTSFPLNTAGRLYNTPCLSGDPTIKRPLGTHQSDSKDLTPQPQIQRLFPIFGKEEYEQISNNQLKIQSLYELLENRFSDVLNFQRENKIEQVNNRKINSKEEQNEKLEIFSPDKNSGFYNNDPNPYVSISHQNMTDSIKDRDKKHFHNKIEQMKSSYARR